MYPQIACQGGCTGCISLTFPCCVSLNVPSNGSIEIMHNYTDCICLAFHHCVVPNVFSNCLALRMHSHTGCICLVFLDCVFSNVSLLHLDQSRNIHSGYTCLIFLCCVFSNVISNCFHNLMQNYIGCIYLPFLHYSCFRSYLCLPKEIS